MNNNKKNHSKINNSGSSVPILQREQIQNIPLTHISPPLSTSLFLLQIFKTTDCINDQTCTSPSFFKLNLKNSDCIILLDQRKQKQIHFGVSVSLLLQEDFQWSSTQKVCSHLYLFLCFSHIFLSVRSFSVKLSYKISRFISNFQCFCVKKQ